MDIEHTKGISLAQLIIKLFHLTFKTNYTITLPFSMLLIVYVTTTY